MAKSKIRVKMPVSERAKQFAPFAALKGLPEALAEKERIIVEKITLSEETSAELNRKLKMVRIGDVITAIYFCSGEYIEITGKVTGLNSAFGELRIVDARIPLDDLRDIRFEADKILPTDGKEVD